MDSGILVKGNKVCYQAAAFLGAKVRVPFRRDNRLKTATPNSKAAARASL